MTEIAETCHWPAGFHLFPIWCRSCAGAGAGGGAGAGTTGRHEARRDGHREAALSQPVRPQRDRRADRARLQVWLRGHARGTHYTEVGAEGQERRGVAPFLRGLLNGLPNPDQSLGVALNWG